jgi:hypothetical protein
MTARIFITSIFALMSMAVNAQSNYSVYKGKIDKYNITMYLSRENYEWQGYYVYDDRPNKKFTLKCVSDEPDPRGYNNVVLKEYSPKGNNTGTFKGKIEGRGDGFYGTFTNSQGQSMRFELLQQYE